MSPLMRLKTLALTVPVMLAVSSIQPAEKVGGEGFEIYLDNKLVLQRFGSDMKKVSTLTLDAERTDLKLTVKYHHCGRIGKDRQITLRDEKNQLVKQWQYPDKAVPVAAMTCNMESVFPIKKARTGNLKLYYSSSELPEGRLLAILALGKSNHTSP